MNIYKSWPFYMLLCAIVYAYVALIVIVQWRVTSEQNGSEETSFFEIIEIIFLRVLIFSELTSMCSGLRIHLRWEQVINSMINLPHKVKVRTQGDPIERLLSWLHVELPVCSEWYSFFLEIQVLILHVCIFVKAPVPKRNKRESNEF